MKIADIRKLSLDEMQTRLNDAREELMKLRFQQSTGELQDHTRLRQTRRTIAQIATVIAEQKRNSESQVSNE
ncbi:MAG TPA: 50S ribosomal protein L29 [Anaerolineales bacterium]|nr:50S ribosomal protein L29 [Anaerolineales bacterium]